jgi:hypothetical protein
MNYDVALAVLHPRVESSARAAEFQILELRLRENLHQEMIYGASENLGRERSIVVAELNRLALEILGLRDALPRLEHFAREAEASLGMAPELALAVLAFSSPEDCAAEEARPSRGQSSASPADSADTDSLEGQISQLYEELRQLVARAAHDPAVRGEIERKRQQLRSLQAVEADRARQRAEARLPFTLTEGREALERAARRLER